MQPDSNAIRGNLPRPTEASAMQTHLDSPTITHPAPASLNHSPIIPIFNSLDTAGAPEIEAMDHADEVLLNLELGGEMEIYHREVIEHDDRHEQEEHEDEDEADSPFLLTYEQWKRYLSVARYETPDSPSLPHKKDLNLTCCS